MTLLLVEDDQNTILYLQKGLAESGFVVDVAEGGESALHLADAREYDLVILDVMLPGRDGWSVLRELRVRGNVTTHDALTYSAKAATHRHVHPYLRYGILIGEKHCVPSRIIHHGTQFDFMAAWPAEEPSATEWKVFVRVLKDEVNASRLLQKLMERHSHTLIHRPLILPLAKASTQKPPLQQL